jgi:hypothetical protein
MMRFRYRPLELATTANVLRWPATVAFTSAPLDYPLLGMLGFLQFFDATFLGVDQQLSLTPATSFPGTVRSLP